jgi:putative transport protein
VIPEPVLALVAVVTAGLILGKVKVAGIALDNAAVIFSGLVLGALGLVIPPVFQTLGLIFFVFSVGMQSGPGFLSAFGRGGWPLIGATTAMILASVATMEGLALVFHIDPRLALGLFTGGRSSNSALAVGVQSTSSNLPALGHSLAYPLAVLAILIFVRILPILFRADLAREEKEHREQWNRENPPLVTRTYRVDNPNAGGRTLGDLHIGKLTGVNVSRILHGTEILVPAADLVLHLGDLVRAVGTEQDLAGLELLLGPETNAPQFVEMPLDQKNEALWLTVTRKTLVNVPLNRLGLRETYGATVTRVQRHGIEISPQATTVLKYADRIMVVAGKSAMPELRSLTGDPGRTVDKDFLPLFLVLSLGLLVGSISVPLGDHLNLSLGVTGGVLVASLVLSAVGRTGPILWAVAESSNRFIRQFGLLLFLGAVGSNAGGQILGILTSHGLALVVTALTIAILPLLVTALVCRFGLKMNILTLLGLLSGSTTCSPALGVVSSLTSSNIANVAYATVYPFAMLFMMVCTQVLAAFL